MTNWSQCIQMGHHYLTDHELFLKAVKSAATGDADELRSLIRSERTLQKMHDSDSMKLVTAAVKRGYIDVLHVLSDTYNCPSFVYHPNLLPIACDNRWMEQERISEQESAKQIADRNSRLAYRFQQHVKPDTTVQDFPAVVTFLLNRRCDVNQKAYSTGDTPLHVAARGGTTAVVALLLAAGAKIESHNKFGQTPLHIAASVDNFGVAVMLLQNGADVFVKSVFKMTALEWARDTQQRMNSYSISGPDLGTALPLQNETRTTILLAIVGDDLEDLKIYRKEEFVLAMKTHPYMEDATINKMLETTDESVHISTKNIDIAGIVKLVDIIADRMGMSAVSDD
jgi:Ankyrin repeats (3 copies)